MHIPTGMKRELRNALYKLDDCRAILETVNDIIAIDDTPEYQDTLDVLREEIQDMLEGIYLLDTDIARWAHDVPENDK